MPPCPLCCRCCSEWVWGDWKGAVTTTNVTTTTIIGLSPSTRYQFRIAAMNEDVVRCVHWISPLCPILAVVFCPLLS
jgi:hypothetical protein